MSASADIKIGYGVNLIDFNGDGVPDVVVKSIRPINDSTSVDMTTVYIKEVIKRFIVPSIYANALSLYDNKIKVQISPSLISNSFERKDHVVLLSAEKVGNNLQKLTIRFSSYSILENKRGDEIQFK